MQNRILQGLATLALTLVTVGSASGAATGHVCNPLTSADASLIKYDQWGVFNDSTTTSATVACGSGQSVDGVNGAVIRVAVYDRHPSSNVSCVIRAVKDDGDPWITATKNSSGNSPAIQRLELDAFQAYVNLASATCTLPPKTAASGPSYVASIYEIDING